MWLIILFWICLGLAVHPYVTYPIIMLFWSILRPRRVIARPIFPPVSLVIAAFNEQDTIAPRIENALEQDYPQDRLEIIVSSDGSTDGTNEIVREYAAADDRLSLLELPRAGKGAAINAAVKEANGEIVVVSDAATHFSKDVVKKLVAHFADSQVYCVVGRVTMLPVQEAPYKMSESLYWRYDMRLRELEGVVGLAFIGSGPCMAIRKEHYPVLEDNAIDDLTSTLRLIRQGGRIVQVSNLGAYDYMDGNTQTQIRSRSRRVTGSLYAIWYNRAILNPFRYPKYAFCIMSHKITRYLLAFWLLGMLVASGLLGLWQDVALYRHLFYVQLAFYGLGCLGSLISQTWLGKIPLLSVPLAVCVVSLAFLRGIGAFVRGHQSARWEPAGPTDRQ